MVEQSKWIQEKVMIIFAHSNLVSLLLRKNYDLIKTFSISKVCLYSDVVKHRLRPPKVIH